jgi:S-DNA-T family DNA segregation ATPase FtsK/SpoIIIE
MIAEMNHVIKIMEARYSSLAEAGVRNIKEYNVRGCDKMPRIVIIIDEFADLMLINREIETLIMRIAQKGRAAGIHLIISSQRSSVNVFTGVIKANIPTRASLHVETTVESKITLDASGAEYLSMQGDMLYSSIMTECHPIRVQIPFLSENDLLKLIK